MDRSNSRRHRTRTLGRGRRWAFLGLVLAGIVSTAAAPQPLVFAQANGETSAAGSRRSRETAVPTPDNIRRRGLPAVTPEREAAALTFVRQHHPELVELLVSLSENSPRIYQRAIAELFRTSERLAQIQERQPDRYELELELWKAESRGQLIAARISMGDDPQLRQKLRELLARQVQAKRRLLMLERDRLQARLEKLDGQIRQLESGQEEYIEQQINQLTRSVQRATAASRAAKSRGKSSDDRPAPPASGKKPES